MARGAVAATTAYSHRFFINQFVCNMEECLDYLVEQHFPFMRIDDQRIGELIEKSKIVINEVGFEFNPYFKIQ